MWVLTCRVEKELAAASVVHFEFFHQMEVPESVQTIAWFDKEPEVKSWTISMKSKQPPCPIIWSMVPEFYRWAAMDKEGEWYLYVDKPECGISIWDLKGSGMIDEIPLKTPEIDWTNSLYQRPG